MAQSRYHNYQRPLASLDENFRLLAGISPGVRCGFDTLAAVAGNTVSFSHETSGIPRTEANSTVSNKQGCVVTRQGFYIYEDEAIQVNVDFNPSANWRVDLLILNHSYLASVGGSLATYSVIKGADNAPGVTPPNFSYPLVSNPATQVPIGYIFVPAGAVDHSGTKWRRLNPLVAGQEVYLKDVKDVLTLSNALPQFNNFNYIQESGLYYVNTASNAPTTATTEWFLMVMKKGAMVVQFAQAKTSGKAYSRGTTNGTTWQPWSNLNNSDITTSITNLEAAIGDRMYSENNYLVDAETITASLDKLDIEIKNLDDLIVAATTSISNLEAAIGNRAYSQNNYIANGESITDSLNKLDIALKALANSVNPDLVPWRDDVTWDSDASTYAPRPLKFKVVNGILYLKGKAQYNTPQQSGSTLFTLPADARPSSSGEFSRIPISPQSMTGTAPFFLTYTAGGSIAISEGGIPNPMSSQLFIFDGIQIPMDND